MSSLSELDKNADPVKFALTEYESISHMFSSGLNAMAVLLPLFFLFTGAALSYVGNLFGDMAKPLSEIPKTWRNSNIHPIVFWNNDYRVWQIYFISAIAIVFSIWSLAFVFVFRNAAGKMLQRASEIEVLFPGLPDQHQHKSFALLNNWYNTPERLTALRTLFWSTVVFYALIFLSYIAIIVSAFNFNRL
jgi:hypothetical protein